MDAFIQSSGSILIDNEIYGTTVRTALYSDVALTTPYSAGEFSQSPGYFTMRTNYSLSGSAGYNDTNIVASGYSVLYAGAGDDHFISSSYCVPCPVITPTPTATSTATPTPTVTPPGQTNTPTPTPTVTPVGFTPTPTATATATPTATPTPTATFIPNTIGCGVDGFTFPDRVTCETQVYNVYVGSATGSIELYYQTDSSPDRVEVFYDESKVIDTGFAGGDTLAIQTDLNNALGACGSGSFPIQDTTSTEWSKTGSFEKTTDSEFLTVKTTSPLVGWMTFGIGCQDESFNWTGSALVPSPGVPII